MTDLVDPSEIEEIVGIERHATKHYGRLVRQNGSWRLFILHSQRCVETHEDLRLCVYSQALDKGVVDFWAADAATHLDITEEGFLTQHKYPIHKMLWPTNPNLEI